MGGMEIPEQSGAVAADAVLTGQSTTTSVQAQSFSLRALKQLPSIQNVPHFAILINGTMSCQDCFNIGLDPIPQSADLLRADVVLQQATPGYLYLTTIS